MRQTVAPRRGALAAFAPLILSVALTLIACGGGGDGGGPPSAPPEIPAPPVPKVFRSFQPAVGVLGQASLVSDSTNPVDAPNATSLSNPRGVAVSEDGIVLVADSGNRRALGYQTLPEGIAQPATFVLGQPDLFHGGATGDPEGFSEVNGIAVGAGKIAVVDRSSNRVLIYNGVSPDLSPPVVVGQMDYLGSDTTCDDTHLSHPEAVHITPDGKLIVADGGHSRVLIWETIPSAHGQAANVVLGQSDLDTCDRGTSRDLMQQPRGIWSDGIKLAVADSFNNRVLLWDELTMENGQQPARVLGQANFDAGSRSAPSATTMNTPGAIAFDGKLFAVADTFYNRVLLWPGWPTQTAQAATVVLGQKDFSLGTENDLDGDSVRDPGPAAQTLNEPSHLAFHQGGLLVVDSSNNRVLIFKPN